MSAAFGPVALRCQALAARLLGWRPDEFWRATPAELAASLMMPGPAGAPPDRAAIDRLMEQDDG